MTDGVRPESARPELMTHHGCVISITPRPPHMVAGVMMNLDVRENNQHAEVFLSVNDIHNLTAILREGLRRI